MLSLLKRIIRPGETRSIANPQAWLTAIFGATPSIAGPVVTASNAVKVPAVRCAVGAIAEAIGMLPLHVFQRSGDGSKERAVDHPVEPLLQRAANDFTPAAEFREALTRDALLHDAGGLAYVNRVGGKVIELLRFQPGAVTVECDPDDGSPIYRRTGSNGNAGQVLPRQNILHIRAPGITCPTSDAKEAIALALVLEQHASRLFANGGRPSGLLKFPNKLSGETATRIKESWTAAHAGPNSGKTAVLEEGGDFLPLALNSVDAQFLELRQFAIAEVARAYRVPLVFLQDFSRATWGNSEQMARMFIDHGLMPWLLRWQGEIQLKLFSREEQQTHYAEFQTDAFVRADIGARMEAYSKAIAARILNPNEARALENRPPYEGGDKFENPNTTAPKPTPSPSPANAE